MLLLQCVQNVIQKKQKSNFLHFPHIQQQLVITALVEIFVQVQVVGIIVVVLAVVAIIIDKMASGLIDNVLVLM